MGEVELNKKEGDYKVKIVDGGEYKEPGGGIRKPSREEIDSYKIHRVVVMVIFGIVVATLLLVVIIMIASVDRCEPKPESKKLPWWQSGVVYNVYPRSFKDSNGDGIGDFKGITEKLKYIKDLGVKILYLSSVFKIDTNVDYGYSVIDFNDTNEDYGSLEDFKDLVKAAHDKDLKVIIDFVPSDTSIKHQWFNDSKKQNWYIWKDNVINGTVGSKWAKDNKTNRYYLRQGGKEGKADLNWDNEDVQKELEGVLGFWLDQGVDGFRVVSVKRLFMKQVLSDDLLKINTILNKWYNYTTKKSPDSILIGSSHPADLSLYGTDSRPGLNIVVNFKLVPEDGQNASFYTAKNFKKIIDEYLSAIPKGKWPSWALTSWVHKRVGSNVDAKLAKSLNVLLLTLPGTPLVFYGDEIGMIDVSNSNDSNKSPMQWSNSSNGGFSNVSSWFGVEGNVSSINAKDDNQQILKTFKEAAELRAKDPVRLLDGNLANFTTVQEDDVLAYTFKSKLGIAVAINFGSKSQIINLSSTLGVKEADLKLYTTDKMPGKINMDEVKVPPMGVLVFNVTKT